MKLTGTAILKDDTLVFRNRSEVLRFCKSLNCSEFTYTIEKKKSKRTNPQNAYYHAVVVPFLRDCLVDLGHQMTLESTHEFIKAEFNFKEIVNENTGEVKRVPQSTATLSKSEFSDMIDRANLFVSEWCNCSIPEAGQQTEIDYR